MTLHDWKDIPKEQLSGQIARQVLHGSKVTIARIHISKGGVVPRHSHENEQVSAVLAGKLRFVFDGGETVVEPGQMVEIPPNVPHMVEALEDSLAMDVFAPRREDWIRGDDAYLRR